MLRRTRTSNDALNLIEKKKNSALKSSNPFSDGRRRNDIAAEQKKGVHQSLFHFIIAYTIRLLKPKFSPSTMKLKHFYLQTRGLVFLCLLYVPQLTLFLSIHFTVIFQFVQSLFAFAMPCTFSVLLNKFNIVRDLALRARVGVQQPALAQKRPRKQAQLSSERGKLQFIHCFNARRV